MLIQEWFLAQTLPIPLLEVVLCPVQSLWISPQAAAQGHIRPLLLVRRRKTMHSIKMIFCFLLTGICCTWAAEESTPEFTLRPIGRVRKTGQKTRIVIDREFQAGLLGLDGFSHVYVLYWFDRNDNQEKRSVLQVHPRGNPSNPLSGVFATRSPARPNLIAVSLCRIIKIQDNIVEIDDIDAFPDSPVLDLKPFIPHSEAGDAFVPDWVGGDTREQ